MLDEFFARSPLDVAPDLLGAILHRDSAEGHVTVRLTEVEAYYGPDDPGSHAYRGKTPRTEPMFGEPGRLYVYFSYGMHWCMNLVAHEENKVGAVLLRAAEVLDGHDLVLQRRKKETLTPKIASGPANLAQALGLNGEFSGLSLGDAGIRITPTTESLEVSSGGRVGVSGAGGDPVVYPWRYFLKHNSVSAYRPGKNVPNLGR